MKLTDIDVTLVLGVDSKTIEYLLVSMKTWRKFRPELFRVPWVVFHDGLVDWRKLSMLNALADVQLVHWHGAGDRYETQRERMLTGHVFVPAQHVHTDWALKIDCDAICLSDKPWLNPKWFEKSPGLHNIYVASSWAYTKSKGGGGSILEWCDKLEQFGDRIQSAHGTRLNLARYVSGSRINMKRMASWICFQRTSDLCALAEDCEHFAGGQRLPVPSHDTTLWYWVARLGDLGAFHTERRMFKRRDWTNVPSFDKLQRMVAELVA